MPKSSPKPLDPPNQKKSASTPESVELSNIAARIKSIIRNTLLASPDFPRLYADTVIAFAPNSNEASILAANYKKIVGRTNTIMPNPKDCTHIKVTGVRCGSPALRGEQFCYFHQRMLRTVKGPPASRVHHAALLEDEESIQASLIEVVNALLRGTIELKRAELILRALNTAVRNIRRVKFGIHSDDMVREVPDYPAVPDPEVEAAAAAEAARQATRAEIARVRAEHEKAANAGTAHAGAAQLTTPHVGTGALARPGGPAVSGRSDSSTGQNAAVNPAQRKPPLGVKESAAPKERKITAHRVSGG